MIEVIFACLFTLAVLYTIFINWDIIIIYMILTTQLTPNTFIGFMGMLFLSFLVRQIIRELVCSNKRDTEEQVTG